MDISDILQGLESRNSNDPFADLDNDLGSGRKSGQADLQALTRAWVNERGTPELLPYVSPPSPTRS